jgi:hypothetical protein
MTSLGIDSVAETVSEQSGVYILPLVAVVGIKGCIKWCVMMG